MFCGWHRDTLCFSHTRASPHQPLVCLRFVHTTIDILPTFTAHQNPHSLWHLFVQCIFVFFFSSQHHTWFLASSLPLCVMFHFPIYKISSIYRTLYFHLKKKWNNNNINNIILANIILMNFIILNFYNTAHTVVCMWEALPWPALSISKRKRILSSSEPNTSSPSL